MDTLCPALLDYTPISLEEMERAKLLNRIDTKYVIHESQLNDFLYSIKDEYYLLKIAGEVIHPYETLYFDTPDFQLYLMHHNGKRNRYKLRCRRYVNSGISFFEIKTKTNKSRTIKRRVQVDTMAENLTGTLNEYISNNTPGTYENYIPALRVFFDRLTLVNKNANERLTFDTNLRYKSKGIEKRIGNIVIVEVKQEKHSVSPFRALMKLHRQPRNYLSKYCLGLTCLNNDLKMNRFKQKIHTLSKLGYEIH